MDSLAFIPQFGGLFMTLLAFVVALSVIVAVHEYGHYIVGRWSGIKADVFSLGFGPVLWARTDRHGTRWQIAALPFGGYVKFMGDENAASGTPGESYRQLSPEERRHTMLGAPLWARTLTVAAGPVFNFVLSVLVFAAVMMTQGKVAEPLTVGALKPLPVEGITLEPGDELISVAGHEVPSRDDADGDAFEAFLDAMPPLALLDYEVRRDGEVLTVRGPQPMPPLVEQLAPKSAAYDIDMRSGDVIVAIDGESVVAFSQLKDKVEGSNGRPLQLTVWRKGELIDFVLAPRRVDEPQQEGGFETQWRIGIVGGLAFEPATEALGPVAALSNGVAQVWQVIVGSISGLYHMITGAISSCNMSGPIGIAEVSGAMASQGASSFIWFIAVLSTAVGLLNLFPIPVLDGGHLVFYAYEAVVGRPPSEGALRVMMAAGLALVLGVMIFALGNDLFCP
ncbi:RIP metalloprotease RseP [Roseovarius amoyensis]|uniref:RIP metalloprotease RseP n=1 Tax=Roseovarius amoyensis TaxID=2211448 RepID=UPI000DBE83D7|nr:RIP metalloprotease RseP [Roseovarius amoyensis]